MERTPEMFSSVILIGGESKRFGTPKHLATYNGKTFLDITTTALKPLSIKYSVHRLDSTLNPKLQIIDSPERIGPINGIYQSLKQSTSKYTLITSCDMPLLDTSLVLTMLGLASVYQKTIVAQANGQLIPTFAVYKTSDYVHFKTAINDCNYKLIDVINTIDTYDYQVPEHLQTQLTNVNTKAQLKQITGPFIFSVCGYKNSGKTTLIGKLLKMYHHDNQRVAVLKHDGHDFMIADDTDTGKFINLGSDLTTIYSRTKWQTTSYQPFDVDQWITSLNNIDIVIIEGMKDSPYPKVVIESAEQLEASNKLITVNKDTRNDIVQIYNSLRKVENERF
ncbi:molybdopterin-guanine dinucleotide biosynthesis protein B [Mollicutes bacterium LVI A0039]|nr:molybdopterin-guanine dinucleotide biosynthesis protein B [Mollicutes bacterium LVI A0039]